MSEEENRIKEKLEELRECLEYGLEYKDYISVVNDFDYIEKILEKQQKEIEKLKEYNKQSVPFYKIIDKLDDLELSEELQEKWDNFMSGSEAVTKAYKELIIESKGEKE